MTLAESQSAVQISMRSRALHSQLWMMETFCVLGNGLRM